MRSSFLLFALLLFIVPLQWSFAQKPDLRFDRIDSNEGLSHGTVTSIIQDHKGFMWFGTVDGLNRYNGYEIAVYKHSFSDSTSLISNDILCLFEDGKQNLWIGTTKGINRYDSETDKFIRYPETGDGSASNIFEDQEGDLWFTTGPHLFKKERGDKFFEEQPYTGIGINIQKFFQDNRNTFWAAMENDVYIYHKEKQVYVPHYRDDDQVIPEATIRLKNPRNFVEDEKGNFWIATIGDGLVLYDRDQKQILKKYQHEPGNPKSLPGNEVVSIYEDNKNRIWIGTINKGLSIFDQQQNEFYNYRSNNLDPFSLSFNTVNTIYQDDNGNMWLGTHNHGVNLVSSRKFPHFYVNTLDDTGLSDNNVTSFVEDNKGNIWIGTDGGGLNIFNRRKHEFRRLKRNPSDPESISTNVVTYIMQDAKGYFWIGYWGGGVDVVTPEFENVYRFRHAEADTTSIRRDDVMYLYEDKRANIWVATLHGLDLFHPATESFEHLNLGLGLDNYVTSMLEDQDENLWIGTWNGLKLLDRTTRKVKMLTHDPERNQSLSDNKIYVVFEDSDKRLWVGTSRGLNLLDKTTWTFKQYHVKDGLPGEAIYGILEGEKGNLWLSTGNGLSRFNPNENTFKNFGKGDGLQDKTFKMHACLKLKSGELIFGGGNGFNLFDPEKITDNRSVPPVVLTDLKIFNKSVRIGGADSILSRSITSTSRVNLSYEHSVFSIDFAAINYRSPEQTQYGYMLEGFDQEWVNVENKRTATYTNLDPGEYVFRVKISTEDGVWNEGGTSLLIVIEPPFWKTRWFQLLVSAIVIGVAFAIYHFRTYRARKRRRELEYLVEEQTKELRAARNEALAASQSKSEFLANMSHEIRTPMNCIIGMAELAYEANPNARQREYLNMIIQSSDALLAIINDILDYSKIEAGKLELDPTAFDVVELVENVVASFSVKANEMDVELLCEISDIPQFVIADPVRIRQVITNLVGNALKFTSEGEVLVSIEHAASGREENEILLHIKVKDTGIGIPPEKLHSIFENFSQADTSITRKYGGTGLGLTISQRLVQLMGGEIWVESQEGVGSTFHFTIECLTTEHTTPLPIVRRDSLQDVHMLVVDDNKTNCILLHELLTSQGAEVSTACSGDEGLEKISNEYYSIIFLDYQMPGMDGLDFIAQFRKHSGKHSNTRIIMLSSIADMTMAEVRQAGIDGYLTKPVRRKELWSVIDQVLEQKTRDKRPSKETVKEQKGSSAKRVLLAEDVKANQVVARHMLSRFGITLEMANDGMEAMEMLKRQKYDVVFMDIQMPHADGYQITRELRGSIHHINHKVPVIAMTANAMPGDLAKCMEAGMDDYIPKPIKMKVLKEKIAKWILSEEMVDNPAEQEENPSVLIPK